MKFIIGRLGRSIFLVLGAVFLSFVFASMAPGNYFDEMKLNPQISPRTIAALHERYGLDRPVAARFSTWVSSAARGDFGYSFAFNRPVAPLLLTRAQNTLLLAVTTTLLSWLLAIPLGTWLAVRRGTWVSRIGGISVAGLLVTPDILLALGVLIVAVRTGFFPVGGMYSVAGTDSTWRHAKDLVTHIVGPAIVLILGLLPMLTAHVRSAMSSALDSPSVRAAEAHGIGPWRIVYRYAFPLSANPLISLFGVSLATLLSSTLLVEVIMSWPGLGPFFLEAIFARDIYCVIGTVFLSTLFLVAGTLTADLMLYAADPRIRKP
jgi:peptide/nickel transport system permease protein